MWSSKSWLSMVAGETNVSWLLDLLGQTPAMEGRTVGTREIEGEKTFCGASSSCSNNWSQRDAA